MAAEVDAAPLAKAWHLYFDEDYDAEDRRRMLVAELVGFFATPQGARFFALGRCICAVGGGCGQAGADVAFSVDYDDLAAACGSADLVASLEVQPVEGLACLACSAHEVKRLERRRRKRKSMLSECVTSVASRLVPGLGGRSLRSRRESEESRMHRRRGVGYFGVLNARIAGPTRAKIRR